MEWVQMKTSENDISFNILTEIRVKTIVLISKRSDLKIYTTRKYNIVFL